MDDLLEGVKELDEVISKLCRYVSDTSEVAKRIWKVGHRIIGGWGWMIRVLERVRWCDGEGPSWQVEVAEAWFRACSGVASSDFSPEAVEDGNSWFDEATLRSFTLQEMFWASLALGVAWLSLLSLPRERKRARRRVRNALEDILLSEEDGGRKRRAGRDSQRSNMSLILSKLNNVMKVFGGKVLTSADEDLKKAVAFVRSCVEGEGIRLKALLEKVSLQQILKVLDLLESAKGSIFSAFTADKLKRMSRKLRRLTQKIEKKAKETPDTSSPPEKDEGSGSPEDRIEVCNEQAFVDVKHLTDTEMEYSTGIVVDETSLPCCPVTSTPNDQNSGSIFPTENSTSGIAVADFAPSEYSQDSGFSCREDAQETEMEGTNLSQEDGTSVETKDSLSDDPFGSKDRTEGTAPSPSNSEGEIVVEDLSQEDEASVETKDSLSDDSFGLNDRTEDTAPSPSNDEGEIVVEDLSKEDKASVEMKDSLSDDPFGSDDRTEDTAPSSSNSKGESVVEETDTEDFLLPTPEMSLGTHPRSVKGRLETGLFSGRTPDSARIPNALENDMEKEDCEITADAINEVQDTPLYEDPEEVCHFMLDVSGVSFLDPQTEDENENPSTSPVEAGDAKSGFGGLFSTERLPEVAVLKRLPSQDEGGFERFIVQKVIEPKSPCKGEHQFILLDDLDDEEDLLGSGLGQRTFWKYENDSLQEMTDLEGIVPVSSTEGFSLSAVKTKALEEVKVDAGEAQKESPTPEFVSQSVSIISDAVSLSHKERASDDQASELHQAKGSENHASAPQPVIKEAETREESYIMPSLSPFPQPSDNDLLRRYEAILNITPPPTPSLGFLPNSSQHSRLTHSHNWDGWLCQKMPRTQKMVCVRWDEATREAEDAKTLSLVCVVEQATGLEEISFKLPLPAHITNKVSRAAGREGRANHPSAREAYNAARSVPEEIIAYSPASDRISDYLSDMGPETQEIFLKPNVYKVKKGAVDQRSASKDSTAKTAPQTPGNPNSQDAEILVSYFCVGSSKRRGASSCFDVIEEEPKSTSKGEKRTGEEIEEGGETKKSKTPRSDTPTRPLGMAFNVRTPKWCFHNSFQTPLSDRVAKPVAYSSPRLTRRVIAHGKVRQTGRPLGKRRKVVKKCSKKLYF